MGKKLKIFLVDEKRGVLDVFCEKLRAEGFSNVECFESAEQIPDILPFSNAEAVVHDIQMTVGTDRPLFARLKTDETLPHVKCVVMAEKTNGIMKKTPRPDAFVNKIRGFKKLLLLLEGFDNQLQNPEKRMFKRFEHHKFLTVFPDTRIMEKLMDISLTGLSFESRENFRTGEHLKIMARAFSQKEPKPLDTFVVRREDGLEKKVYGLRFSRPPIPGHTHVYVSQPKEVKERTQRSRYFRKLKLL